MKRIYSKLTFALVAMLFALVTGANAQTWDFSEEGIGVIDAENLSADNVNWEYESSNDRYKNTAAYLPVSELLKANGQEINFTKGLFLKVAAADGVRLDNKKKCLTLNKATTVITIKNAKKGFKLTIECQGSSKTEARGLNVTNITPESGCFNSTSKDLQTNVGIVTEDGNVTIQSTGGIYVYSISLVDPAEEEQGGTVPSADSSVGLNFNRNQVLLTTTENEIKYYNTEDLKGISIDKAAGTVTVKSASSDTPDVFTKSISNISFAKKQETGADGDFENMPGQIQIYEAKGWQESAYVKWAKFDGADSYNVYVDDNTTPIDGQLIREYKNYFRADVVGLKAGTHSLKIVPVASKAEIDGANMATNLTVTKYLREGFAFQGDGSKYVGAYNSDGSLKEGAIVLYVTKDNFNTITCDITTGKNKETRTGLGNILGALEKGAEKRPIAVRFIGDISGIGTSQLSGEKYSLQIKGKGETSYVQVTLEGIGDDATLNGFGVTLSKVTGVEIRNLGIMRFVDDGIQLKTGSYVWVHNNDIFYGQKGSDSDQAKGDGSLDSKDSGSNNTFSFNHFWDSGKMSLCGMKGEATDDVETYHHNWFDHSDSRHPRVRTKTVHVYNNYYDGVSKYGVGATMGSSVFVESNYFRHTKYPVLISKQGSDVSGGGKGTFSGENGGMIKSFGNVYAEKGSSTSYTPVTQNESATAFDCYEASSRDEAVPSSYKTLAGGTKYNNFDTEGIYAYTPDAAADVPAIVTGYYGAGRLNHGDFTWTFDNSVDDTSYAVNKELQSKIESYKNSDFVRILGDLGASSGETGEGGGSTGGGETGGGETVPIEGTVICDFLDKAPSNDAFSVKGNYSKDYGTVTVDGTEYNTCLKLESSTEVSFNINQKMKLMLYFGSHSKDKNNIKIDGVKVQADSATHILETEIEAGSHILTKADTSYLFFIKLVPVTE